MQFIFSDKIYHLFLLLLIEKCCNFSVEKMTRGASRGSSSGKLYCGVLGKWIF